VEQAKRILAAIGLEADRLKMVQMSSAMGQHFAEEAARITDEIRALGPSRLGRVPSPTSRGKP
jgi:coenzyme F420-reducing hydrogenase delta subunit